MVTLTILWNSWISVSYLINFNKKIVLGGDCYIHFEGDSAFRIDVVNFLAGAG